MAELTDKQLDAMRKRVAGLVAQIDRAVGLLELKPKAKRTAGDRNMIQGYLHDFVEHEENVELLSGWQRKVIKRAIKSSGFKGKLKV